MLRFHNWLTRQFTIEYGALFDGLLPALDRLRLPIPLGGTSNHFRVAARLPGDLAIHDRPLRLGEDQAWRLPRHQEGRDALREWRQEGRRPKSTP